MNLIVDASVVVKWLVPEQGSDRAAGLMRLPVGAPDSLVPECLNAVRKKVLRGELTRDAAIEAAELLSMAGIALESTQPLAADILALSMRLSLPAYDCAYLALARRQDGVLVTADARLVSRCREPDAADLGVQVRALIDEGPMVQERAFRPYMGRRGGLALRGAGSAK